MRKSFDVTPDASGKSSLQHAFSLRGLVESGLPSLVFVIAFQAVGTRPAAAIALAVALAITAERLLHRQRATEALSGVAGVALAVALAGGTGQAKDFFLPEVVVGLIGSAVLLGSLGLRRPLLGVVIGAVLPACHGWRDRPLLREAFVRITLVAGVWAAVKAFILLGFYLHDDVALLAGAKLALGYPVLAVLVLYYVRVIRKALGREATTTEGLPA